MILKILANLKEQLPKLVYTHANCILSMQKLVDNSIDCHIDLCVDLCVCKLVFPVWGGSSNSHFFTYDSVLMLRERNLNVLTITC